MQIGPFYIAKIAIIRYNGRRDSVILWKEAGARWRLLYLIPMGKCIMPTNGVFTKVIHGGVISEGDAFEVIEEGES